MFRIMYVLRTRFYHLDLIYLRKFILPLSSIDDIMKIKVSSYYIFQFSLDILQIMRHYLTVNFILLSTFISRGSSFTCAELEGWVDGESVDLRCLYFHKQSNFTYSQAKEYQGVREKARVFETLIFLGKALTQIKTDLQLL